MGESFILRMCVIFPLNVYEARFSMYFPGNLFASPVEAWKGDVLSSGSAVSADRSCECVARDLSVWEKDTANSYSTAGDVLVVVEVAP
jgi:hypothetical protein